MKRYVRLWLQFAKIRLFVNIGERWGAFFFVVGKFARFSFIGLFILTLSSQIEDIKGYTQEQLVIVYLVFNFLDLTSQFLFRSIYSFRQSVLQGSFDKDLLNPINPIFSVLMTGVDFLDVPLWLVNVSLLAYMVADYPVPNLILFTTLLANGLLISTAIHIFVAASTILYTLGQELLAIFRDVSAMARFPIDIYSWPIRIVLHTVIPLGIAFTLPAKYLFDKQSLYLSLLGLVVGGAFFALSLEFWKYAISRYTSASS